MKNDNAKKLLSILCAASLAFSLAACGSVDASDPDDTETPAQIETAAPGGDQTPPDKPDGEPGGQGGPGGSFGGSSTVTQGESANTITTDGTYTGETVTFSAQNGNGVFSYGSGTTVSISDSVITTTADIPVKNAALTANHSEALVIEGQNSITLENCGVSGSMSDTEGASSDENVHHVMIYQSMSGDADVGTSEFSMTGGSLIGKNGDLFYITNTHCILTLSGVTLKNEDPDGYLLRVVGNSASHGWGTAGSNGAQVEFTADAQTLEGNILVDTISTLDRLAHITQLLGCDLKNPDFCLTLGILLRAELQQKRIAQPRT